MSKKEVDISLIRKYLNGELDAHAMHQLEAKAQDDPFLMDAIEGYQYAKNDQQANLTELSGRLQQRLERKERRIIPWRTLSIAASVLIVFMIGGVWLFNKQSTENEKTSLLVQSIKSQQAKPRADSTTANVTVTKQLQEAIELAPAATVAKLKKSSAPVIKQGRITTAPTNSAPTVATTAIAQPVKEDGDSSSLSEMIVMGINKDKTLPLADTIAAKQSIAAIKVAKKVPATAPEVQLTNKVPGLMKTQAPGTEIYPNGQPKIRFVAGKILDKTDGSPLPGASVALAGSSKTTVSDANGYFSIPVKNNNSNLVVSSLGYESQNVHVYKTKLNDSLNIQLNPANSSLNEVVAVGYGDKLKEVTIKKPSEAIPAKGWINYKQYLKENAISPDGKAGIVTLTFMVDKDGNISEMKVVNGLSEATNKKATDLVVNGPKWTGNTTGQTQQVKLNIKFPGK